MITSYKESGDSTQRGTERFNIILLKQGGWYLSVYYCL